MNAFFATAILLSALITLFAIAHEYGTFGHIEETCYHGVKYIETYHGVSVELTQAGRVVRCQ